ncbi:MAG: hypothetical protein BAA04_13450 [Firmicutes bacterium ZCTH02-B6]|nr:MAG: hypothetical protein BAA04_13450 [Firmicutes bacterium ZCTH02-B6]
MAMDEALGAAFGSWAAQELSARAAVLAEQAAKAMEEALGREFMEMSLDLGIDDRQRLWIFELNSKPLRFDERDIQRRWVHNLIQYVQAVAGDSQPPERRPAAGYPLPMAAGAGRDPIWS